MTDFNGATARGRLSDDVGDIIAKRHLPIGHIAMQTGRCVDDVRRVLDGVLPKPVTAYRIVRREEPAKPNPFVRTRGDSWWTPAREDHLVSLWRAGERSSLRLATAVGNTRCAVRGKIKRLKRDGRL